MKILVIDDNRVMLHAIKAVLLEKGHQVYLASNGIQALNKMYSVQMDCIISDVVMPDTPIMSLICSLKNFYKKAVPLILVSTFISNPLIDNALILGADAFIPKPIDFKLLGNVIDRLVSSIV